jgi:hypothetical protein
MLPLGWPQAAAFRVLLMVMAVGSLMGTCMEAEQPLASVTVAVCEPALRLVTVLLLWPLLQLKVYGESPPPAFTWAAPSLPPKQLTLVVETKFSEGPDEFETPTDCDREHPLASVTVTV